MNDTAKIAEDAVQSDSSEPKKVTPETLDKLNPIIIDERKFKYSDQPLYRVYSAPGEFKLVDAGSAHEAFAKSEIANVFKIEQEAFYRHIVVPADLLEDKDSEGVAFDTVLPDPSELNTFLVAALEPISEEDAAVGFEELSFGDLNKKPDEQQPEKVADATPEAEPEVAQEPPVEDEKEVAAEAEAPTVEAAVEEPSSDELSPEEVDALLSED